MLLYLHLTITYIYINHNNYLKLYKISSSIKFFFKLKPTYSYNSKHKTNTLKPIQINKFNTILINK